MRAQRGLVLLCAAFVWMILAGAAPEYLARPIQLVVTEAPNTGELKRLSCFSTQQAAELCRIHISQIHLQNFFEECEPSHIEADCGRVKLELSLEAGFRDMNRFAALPTLKCHRPAEHLSKP